MAKIDLLERMVAKMQHLLQEVNSKGCTQPRLSACFAHAYLNKAFPIGGQYDPSVLKPRPQYGACQRRHTLCDHVGLSQQIGPNR